MVAQLATTEYGAATPLKPFQTFGGTVTSA